MDRVLWSAPNVNGQTDEALALGLQQGRKEDLAVLIERHYSKLVGYLYRLTGGDRMLSEDLAQETFLRALRSIGQYTHPRPFKPWLYAIATHLTRTYFARAEFRRTVEAGDLGEFDEDAPGPVEEMSPPLDAALLADEDLRAVVGALRALPPQQREVIILRYYEEWSLNDIAAALSIPLGTVKSRLFTGLRRLRVLLITEEAHDEHL